MYYKPAYHALVLPIPRLFWEGKPIDSGYSLPELLGKTGVSLSTSVVGGNSTRAGGSSRCSSAGISSGGWPRCGTAPAGRGSRRGPPARLQRRIDGALRRAARDGSAGADVLRRARVRRGRLLRPFARRSVSVTLGCTIAATAPSSAAVTVMTNIPSPYQVELLTRSRLNVLARFALSTTAPGWETAAGGPDGSTSAPLSGRRRPSQGERVDRRERLRRLQRIPKRPLLATDQAARTVRSALGVLGRAPGLQLPGSRRTAS